MSEKDAEEPAEGEQPEEQEPEEPKNILKKE
jgi:hypothetical protein